MTTSDYFQRALRRPREMPVGESGALIHGEDGSCASFWIQAKSGLIISADYRCTTCATLLAFCEHLSELAIGMPVDRAAAYNETDLISLHPGIPHSKANRAKLASDAFRSAVQQIQLGERT